MSTFLFIFGGICIGAGLTLYALVKLGEHSMKNQSNYTEEEIKMAQYLEQKTQSDQRYYAFRQMMHEAARDQDKHP